MTKEFSIQKNIFVCVINDGNYSGSLQFDFSTGEIMSNKPDNMDMTAWLICCRKFIALCMKMNAPFLDI